MGDMSQLATDDLAARPFLQPAPAQHPTSVSFIWSDPSLPPLPGSPSPHGQWRPLFSSGSAFSSHVSTHGPSYQLHTSTWVSTSTSNSFSVIFLTVRSASTSAPRQPLLPLGKAAALL